MKSLKLLLLIVAICFTGGALGALIDVAHAQTPASTASVPLVSITRFSVDAGLNAVWYSAPISDDLPRTHEFQVGGYAAYQLSPLVALTGRIEYGLDSKWLYSGVGIRFHLFQGVK